MSTLPVNYQLKFYSRGKQITVSPDYWFMDNGSCIQYFSKNHSFASSIIVPKKEWNKLKPFLTEDIEQSKKYSTAVKMYSI